MKITKTIQSKIENTDFDNLSFGKCFSDHMFNISFKNNKWQNPEILPYGPLSLNPGTHVFHYGQEVEACNMQRTWDQAVKDFEVEAIRARIEKFNSQNHFKKKGFAMMPVCFGISFTKTFLNQGSSLVHVYTDGSVSVTTGGIEMGQGISSNMIAICSRTFGISSDRIKCNSTNTTRIANISPSAASSTTDLNGNATIIACREILEGMKKVGA